MYCAYNYFELLPIVSTAFKHVMFSTRYDWQLQLVIILYRSITLKYITLTKKLPRFTVKVINPLNWTIFCKRDQCVRDVPQNREQWLDGSQSPTTITGLYPHSTYHVYVTPSNSAGAGEEASVLVTTNSTGRYIQHVCMLLL